MADTTAIVLTREQLTGVKNLFVLNPANTDFLLGTSQRRSGAPTLIAPLLFLILAVILGGCPAAAAAGTPDGQNTLIGLAVIIGLPCLIAASLTYRAYRRALRLDTQGQLLEATIASVSAHERSKTSNILLTLLAIVIIIIDILSIFDSSSRTTTVGTYSPGDLYEVILHYTATTPTGKTISEAIKRNRPDLRGGTLPYEGDPIVLLYVDDALYKVM